MVDHLVPTPVVDIFNVNPALEAGTNPMGFPKGRSGSSPPIDSLLGRPRGFKPCGRYILIRISAELALNRIVSSQNGVTTFPDKK